MLETCNEKSLAPLDGPRARTEPRGLMTKTPVALRKTVDKRPDSGVSVSNYLKE